MNSKLLCLLCCTVYYCITADQNLFLGFIVGWLRGFYFYDKARIKGKYFLSFIKSPLMLTKTSINNNKSTELAYSPLATDVNPDGYIYKT